MALNIRKLNGDTTFLMSFVADASDNGTSSKFTILLDPWLQGQSSWVHPSFQFSQHTVAPVIESLAQIADQVDLIVVSQDKPDHCHRQTLCSWPLDKKIAIYAAPAAARKIRDWKYFPTDCIHDLTTYNPAVPSTLFKFAISSASTAFTPAEFTIANLSSKKDLTGLHNALAMTFLLPARIATQMYRHDSVNDDEDTKTSEKIQLSPLDSATLAIEPEKKSLRSRLKSYRSLRSLHQQYQQHQRQQLLTPPHTPDDQACLSCIYTPHGFSQSLLEPYVHAHLIPARALPLDVLLHSTVKEQNPWYMGGVVAAGTPGGIEVIRSLNGQVKTWITAHDERKDNRGVSVALLKTRYYDDGEINALLKESGYHDVNLMCLESGQEVVLAG